MGTNHGIQEQWRGKGGIVNVPVNVDTTTTLLPRQLDDSNIIYVSLARRMCYSKDYIKGNISPAKTWRAADYLSNQELYQLYSIHLDNSWIKNSNTDTTDANNNENQNTANDANNEQMEEEEEINVSSQEILIINDNESLRFAPAEGRTPLSVLTDQNIDYLAFPKIFCEKRLVLQLIESNTKIPYSSVIKPMARRYDRRAVSRVD